MKKKLLVAVLAFTMVFALSACGSSNSDDSADSSKAEITTDKDKGTVTFKATVNESGLKKDSTMHYIVQKGGKAADAAIFNTDASPEDIYNALEEVGGKPWNTEKKKIDDGEFTDGQKVKVTLTWDGQDDPIDFTKTVKSDKGNLKGDIRFSGNLDNNKDCGSGCVMCLNSCWAGILSNAAYGVNAIDGGDVLAQPDTDVLPEAGTEVQVTFQLEK